MSGRRGAAAALQRLASLAARLLAAPAAQAQLVGGAARTEGRSPGALRARAGTPRAAADHLCGLTAAQQAPLVLADAAADPRAGGGTGGPGGGATVGAFLGVPLRDAGGRTLGAVGVLDDRPRAWSAPDVALLEQLATSAAAELELSALAEEYGHDRVVWELAIDAAGVGTFDWDLTSGTLTWDDRLLRMFGYERGEFGGTIEAFGERLHPDDAARVGQALRRAIATCGQFEAEYRVLLPGGRTRWVAAAGRALAGTDGAAERMLGAAYDVTGSREGEARVRQLLESMTSAFYSLDEDWRFTYVNAEAERLLGRRREELLGGVLWDLFPAAVGSEFEQGYRSARSSGRAVAFDAYYPEPLEGWYEVRAWPDGRDLAVSFVEVTARRRAQEEAERVAARVSLLADVTAELSGTLDADEAVGRLARLLVPALGDWCIVTLVDDDVPGGQGGSRGLRGLRDVGWWHADPASRPLVRRYGELRIPALAPDSFVARALATGEVVEVPEHATRVIGGVLAPGEARDLLARLAPASAALLPLRGRGRTSGLLTLFRGPARPAVAGEDLRTLRQVADRAGLALDSARLYRQQRDLAEGLQRALLTAPPEPDDLRVAVRYAAAAEAARVGGDWYDAFLQPDGATVLVIGDVVGHDTAAAAAMGQVRGLLRGIAATTGDGPAEVLRRLDTAMELLRVSTTATAVVARLEQGSRERAAGTRVVRWSNAGHPPPMVLAPDGAVRVLAPPAGVDADLLLGIPDGGERRESAVELAPGATLLLYTDGLVERRGQSLDQGLALLSGTLAALAPRNLGPQELCDELLARMLPPRRDDDVALVAVRLDPQDGPGA